MNPVTADLGVYRMLRGHTQGVVPSHKSLREQNAPQEAGDALTTGKSKGLAFAIQREQALNQQEVVLHHPDLKQKPVTVIEHEDITSSCAGSIAQSRYLQGLISGSVEGPIPMSALIARQNYERAKKILAP